MPFPSISDDGSVLELDLHGATVDEALRLGLERNTALRQDLDSLAARTQALIQERTSYRAAIDSLLRQ